MSRPQTNSLRYSDKLKPIGLTIALTSKDKMMTKIFLQALSIFALALCGSALAAAQTATTPTDVKARAVTDGVKDPTPATAITATASPGEPARAEAAPMGVD